MSATQTTKEWHEEIEYQEHVLSALLYFSTTCSDSIRLPTIKKLVHKEIADAIIEYATGNKKRELLYDEDGGLEHYTWLNYEKQMKNAARKLPGGLEKTFAELLEAKYDRDEMGDGAWDSLFNMYFTSPWLGICGIHFTSTYSLSMEFVRKVQKKILPGLPKEEVAALEELGKLMRRHIDFDLKYVKSNYYW